MSIKKALFGYIGHTDPPSLRSYGGQADMVVLANNSCLCVVVSETFAHE